MAASKVVSESTIAERLEQLAELYRQAPASQMMVRTLEKMLAYEAQTCQEQVHQLQADLVAFEQQYGFSSAEFYQRFQQGQTDDRMDLVEWASLVQMGQNLERRFSILSGEQQT